MSLTPLKTNIQKAYDDIAPNYLKWTSPTYALRLSYIRRLLSYLPPPQPSDEDKESSGNLHVLELGCGAGIPSTQFLSSQPSIKVTANDLSTAQIALARSSLPESVTLLQGDMMELEFEPDRFNAVVAFYSFIHLPREEQRVLLERMYGWLRGGGCVLGNFTAREEEGVTGEGWLGATEGEMFWSGWGVEGTKRVLTEVGFEVVVGEVVEDLEEGGDGEMKEVPFYWVIARKPVLS